MWYHNMGPGAWALMSVATVAFWALIVWLVVALVRDNGPDEAGNELEPPTASAERILAERYAHGDIDADDYHHRLEDLRRAHLSGSRS